MGTICTEGPIRTMIRPVGVHLPVLPIGPIGWQDRYMLNMEKITWPAVVAIIAALGTVVALVWLKQDLTAIGVVIAGLLGANFLQQSSTKQEVTEVKSNTNGNNKVLVEALLRDRERDREIIQRVLLALPPGTELNTSPKPDDDTKVIESDTLY